MSAATSDEWFEHGSRCPPGGTVCVNGEEYTKAGCYGEALRVDPKQASGWFTVANDIPFKETVVVNGTVFTQNECLLEALRLNPKFRRAWFKLGCSMTTPTVVVNGNTYTTEECYIAALLCDDKHDDAVTFAFAAQHHFPALLEELRKRKADVNKPDNECGLTPVSWAAWKGHTTCVEFFVGCGADLDVKDNFGRTALQYAALGNHLECVKTLVVAGATISAANAGGWVAAGCETSSAIKQLLHSAALAPVLLRSFANARERRTPGDFTCRASDLALGRVALDTHLALLDANEKLEAALLKIARLEGTAKGAPALVDGTATAPSVGKKRRGERAEEAAVRGARRSRAEPVAAVAPCDRAAVDVDDVDIDAQLVVAPADRDAWRRDMVRTWWHAVDTAGVVASFLSLDERLWLRLVHSRCRLGVTDVLHTVKFVSVITDAQLARLVAGTTDPTSNVRVPASFPELRSVDVCGCERLTVAGFRSLRSLGALERLVLGRGGIASSFLTDALLEVSRIKTLKSLDVTGCQCFSTACMTSLLQLPRLETLDVSGCLQLDAAAFAVIARLPALKSLTLAGYRVRDAALAPVCNAVRLTSLNLSWCFSLTPIGAAHLARLTALQTLIIPCNVDDAWLAAVGGLVSLTTLVVYLSCRVTDAGVARLSALVRLTELDLSRCDALTDQSFTTLARFVRLEKLNVSKCPLLTAAGLQQLRGLTALKELQVDGCKLIPLSGPSMRPLLTTLPGLKVFKKRPVRS